MYLCVYVCKYRSQHTVVVSTSVIFQMSLSSCFLGCSRNQYVLLILLPSFPTVLGLQTSVGCPTCYIVTGIQTLILIIMWQVFWTSETSLQPMFQAFVIVTVSQKHDILSGNVTLQRYWSIFGGDTRLDSQSQKAAGLENSLFIFELCNLGPRGPASSYMTFYYLLYKLKLVLYPNQLFSIENPLIWKTNSS